MAFEHICLSPEDVLSSFCAVCSGGVAFGGNQALPASGLFAGAGSCCLLFEVLKRIFKNLDKAVVDMIARRVWRTLRDSAWN